MTQVPASSHGGAAAATDNLTLTAVTATSVDPVLKLVENATDNFDLFGAFAHSGTELVLIDQPGSGEVLVVGPDVVGDTPLVVSGALGQTADLVQVLSSNGTALSGFDRGGFYYTEKHAAPADGTLVAGRLALWFDQTNGAPKLMVKAKQADGTVVAASVALA